jgi:transcriptional regulator GlxA family with amidase domain
MQRRGFLTGAAAFGLFSMWPGGPLLPGPGSSGASPAPPIRPPASGPIRVAVALTDGATVIDFAGPWEVLQDAGDPERDAGFELFTVGDATKPVRGSGGLQLVPDHAFQDAPQPHVIVVGAQRGSPALISWLKSASPRTDLTMSVCTGAFQLGKAGLLKGLAATTHHDFYDKFAAAFPDVEVRRGLRFVESSPQIATAGGLSSGIDLALRVVERYYGRETAAKTAAYMEYQSKGWIA